MKNHCWLNVITHRKPQDGVSNYTQCICSCLEVSWGSLMYRQLLMSIEWKLKSAVNLLCLAIDWCSRMLSGKEREITSLLIGIPADNNIDVCFVAVTHPVIHPSPSFLILSPSPSQGQRTPSRAWSCVWLAEDVSVYVWCSYCMCYDYACTC